MFVCLCVSLFRCVCLRVGRGRWAGVRARVYVYMHIGECVRACVCVCTHGCVSVCVGEGGLRVSVCVSACVRAWVGRRVLAFSVYSMQK